jgi:hypothetical protein
MEMQQMMECLLAKMDINQEKADASLREMREEIRAG